MSGLSPRRGDTMQGRPVGAEKAVVRAEGDPKPALTFDPETHTYWLGERKIPSVTQVLQSVGVINTDYFTEEAAWRGSVVHKCCELDDENDLDETSVPEEAKGYLDAWRLFKQQVLLGPFEAIEEPVCGRDYAGTPDRTGNLDVPLFLDIKTGSILPWVGIQLAAYGQLVCSPALPFRRIAVRLDKTGKYNLREFPIRERRADLHIFNAALSIHEWRNK